MFDIWLGDINITVLILIFSVAVILPIQLVLCFKTKPIAVRFTPIIIFALLAMAFVVMIFAATGWNALTYIIFAAYAAFMILICGIGWGIWAIANYIKKKN